MAQCKACDDPFIWDDTVVRVEDDLYHDKCVTLYPTGYVAFLDGEPLGETDNEDGESAHEIFPELLTADDDDA